MCTNRLLHAGIGEAKYGSDVAVSASVLTMSSTEVPVADRMVECDKGIHFWLTKEEAAAWTG
jgi:hypothetical protein